MAAQQADDDDDDDDHLRAAGRPLHGTMLSKLHVMLRSALHACSSHDILQWRAAVGGRCVVVC